MRALIGLAVFVVGCKGGWSSDNSDATSNDDFSMPPDDTGSNADGTTNLTTEEHTAQYDGGSVGILGVGRSLAGVGDANGDGLDDLLIGQAGSNGHSGSAALVLGAANPGDVDLATQAITYSSTIASELVGTAVAPAGDYDGDGFADLLIGGCHCYPGEAGVGGAYVVLGSEAPVGFDLVDADARITGEAIGDDAGDILAGGGDFDGDGFDDVVVGANHTSYLILGGETVADRGLDAADVRFEDGVPSEIAYAGDVDADGLDELVFLELGDTARLVLGGGGSSVVDLDDVDATYSLGEPNGTAADGAGDVDGDGAADLVLSGRVPEGTGPATGVTWLFLGGEIGDHEASDADATYLSEVGDDSAGFRIAGAGDVDGDDLDDLLIGAPNYLDTNGASYIVLGSTEPASRLLEDADVRIVGADLEFVGLPLSDAGDFDGDGLADIAIGSEGWFSSTYYLFTGADLAD
jgi:hypothetical protein